MGTLETVLKDEIARLARKEAKKLQEKPKQDIRRLKDRVASLQKEVAALQDELAREQSKRRMAKAQRDLPEDAADQVRMTPGLIKKLRKRLNISQPQLAVLLDVSKAAVGFWESGKSQPRPEMKVQLAALRNLGRRDVQRLLDEKGANSRRRTAS